jgi:cytochrome c553
MVDVGRHFETCGRAAIANRFEFAEFEAGELEDLFRDSVSGAKLPGEGPVAHIPALAQAFAAAYPPDLARAAHAHDAKAFAEAFARAANACNGCHEASAKGFIEVPSRPGQKVPDLDPAPEERSPEGGALRIERGRGPDQ